MPYYKKRRYNNYYRKRKRKQRTYPPWWSKWLMKSGSVQDVAYSALKGVLALRSLINVEKKKYDVSASSTTSGNVIILNSIGQGDTDQSREGNSVLMKSLLFRGYLSTSATAGVTRVRIMLIRDNQQIGDTAPSQSDILDGDFTDPIQAPLNNNTVGRFTVLADRKYCLNQLVAAQSMAQEISIYLRMNKHARYNGTSGSDIQKNGIYCLFIHDQPTYSPQLNYSSRLTYVDN